jgi:hypothetical protein
MTISEFISKYGQFFPVEVVRGKAFSFDAEPNVEWFPREIKEAFNFKTSNWEPVEHPIQEEDDIKIPRVALKKSGLFIRFRPPGEKWLLYPIEMTIVQTISGATVPNEALMSAQFYVQA